MSVLRLAFAMGCLIFLGVSIYLVEVQKIEVETELSRDVIFIGVLVFAVAMFMLQKIITAKKIRAINDLGSAPEKLTRYRSLMITRLALIEAPVLISIIGYFLSANVLLIALAGVLIASFFLLKFSPEKIRQELNI